MLAAKAGAGGKSFFRGAKKGDERKETLMSVDGIGASPYAGMVGAGMRMLNVANQTQTDMAKRLLPMQAAENAGRAASDAKGLFVDTYA